MVGFLAVEQQLTCNVEVKSHHVTLKSINNPDRFRAKAGFILVLLACNKLCGV